MQTLTPLQINDAKRAGLDDYNRDMAARIRYYDQIAFGVERQQARLRRKIQQLRAYGE